MKSRLKQWIYFPSFALTCVISLVWIGYSYLSFSNQQYQAALQLCRVLEAVGPPAEWFAESFDLASDECIGRFQIEGLHKASLTSSCADWEVGSDFPESSLGLKHIERRCAVSVEQTKTGRFSLFLTSPNHSSSAKSVRLDLKDTRTFANEKAAEVLFGLGLIWSFSVLISLTLGWLGVYKLLDRIKTVKYTIAAVSSGDFSVRLTGSLPPPLGWLVPAFNELITSLENNQAAMLANVQRTHRKLKDSLRGMEKQKEALEEAHHRAAALSNAKSDLLASLSHELRTPLNSINGFTSQLLKSCTSRREQALLKTMEQAGQFLVRLLNDLLDVSRLEAGKLILRFQPFDLVNALEAVVELLAPCAHQKGLEVVLKFVGVIPTLCLGDATRIQQVLLNLVMNAIKFTEFGSVTVLVEVIQGTSGEARLSVRVTDTGIGFSKADEPKLFQAFEQVHPQIPEVQVGAGLGLKISQQLIQALGGELACQGRPNGGACFYFELPVKVLNAQAKFATPLPQMLKAVYVYEPHHTSSNQICDWLKSSGAAVLPVKKLSQVGDEAKILICGVSANDCLPSQGEILELVKRTGLERVLFLLPNNCAERTSIDKRCLVRTVRKPLTQASFATALHDLVSKTPLRAKPKRSKHLRRLPLRVMAIDDNPANLQLLNLFLTPMVEAQVLFSSGRSALQNLPLPPADVVLMDLQMPGLDGLETAKRLRLVSGWEQVRLIAVSAYAMEEDQAKVLAAGFEAYLTKPLEQAKLYHALSQNLKPKLSALPIWDETEARRTLGSKKRVLEHLPAFRIELSEVEKQLQEGVGASGVAEWLHRFHGSCAYFGVPKLKALLMRLERQVRERKPVSAADWEALRCCTRLTDQYLEHYLNKAVKASISREKVFL